MKVTILGTGMAGLGAAHRLRAERVPSILFDRSEFYGGHTASFSFEEGFVFDDGPHLSFTKNKRIQDLLAESVQGKFESIDASINNYWRGHWIKHPAQCNLHGLPNDLVVKIIQEIAEANQAEPTQIDNYRDWLFASFGRTFSETFPMEYGHKYHTVTAEQMTTDWIGPRLYRPDFEEVLRGALSPETPNVHYATEFRYPTWGGFQSYLKMFVEEADLRLQHEVVGIDPTARQIRFANGAEHHYEGLVSSIPLPHLIPMIDSVPGDVIEAAEKLAWTTCVVVNVGVRREDISEAHWSYFYDRDIFFSRLNFPHMFSPNTAPPGCGSIQAEIYYSKKYRPLDRTAQDCIEPVLADLRRCGLVREEDEVFFTHATIAPFGNIIFDHDRAPALETVHGFLDEIGVAYCGRYGEWGYHWTDQSFVSGELAAQKILDRNTS